MRMDVRLVEAVIRRPVEGVEWRPLDPPAEFPFAGGVGWQSNGGAGRLHPARGLPYTLEIKPPDSEGRLSRLVVLGVFALYARGDAEAAGAVGGSIQFLDGETVLHRRDLIQGRHYGDATDGSAILRVNGDGTSIKTVGTATIDGESVRVDALSIDIPSGLKPDRILVKDLGTPASFVVFAAYFEYQLVDACPFRGDGNKVALSEIGSILRLRDRARFDRAMHQLFEGVASCEDDLDEARGLALTFLAVVSAALIEMDAPRSMHKLQLEAARELENHESARAIANYTVRTVWRITESVMPVQGSSGNALIDRALVIVERNFAEEIDDEGVAEELCLSTSHFRHLFKQATSQPFNKYLVSLRLDKARDLLLRSNTPVTGVAKTVGFQSSAHFSRAFAKRFGMAPSVLRQARK